MTDMTLKTINRYIQRDIQELKRIEYGEDVELQLKVKRTLGYLYSIAIQGRRADIEERLEAIEKVIANEKDNAA